MVDGRVFRLQKDMRVLMWLAMNSYRFVNMRDVSMGLDLGFSSGNKVLKRLERWQFIRFEKSGRELRVFLTREGVGLADGLLTLERVFFNEKG